MSGWLAASLLDLRARLTGGDEGSLWMLLLDRPGGKVVMAVAFDEAMAHPDEAMADNLKLVISAVPAPAVLLVVPRADGRPRRADHELWQQVAWSQGCEAKVTDLLVVGNATYWSARRAAA
jgi:hypothetical protein